MKRLVLVILLVTAVAALVFPALNRPGAGASRGATIVVNNADDSNSPDGNNEIYVMSAEGTGGTRLTKNSDSGGYADWPPAALPSPTPWSGPCGPCDTGLNTCDLRKGDILLSHDLGAMYTFENLLFSGYWTHAGIYGGDGAITGLVIDSGGTAEGTWWKPWTWRFSDDPGVESKHIDVSGFCKTASDWAILRTKASGAKREAAVTYAQAQDPKKYNWIYPDKWTTDKFYCSQLVWRAYERQGIDLDSNRAALNALVKWLGPWGVADAAAVLAAVPPDDIYFDGDVSVVKQRSGGKNRAVFRLGSPADLYVTDAEGRHTGVDRNTGEVVEEIPGAFYSGPEAEPEFMSIEDLEGTWRIEILGTAEGEYTLQAETIDADNHQVAQVSGDTVEGSVARYDVTYPEEPGEPIVLAPTPSPTLSPTPEATRTLDWGPGWHNATWSGASTPEEAFACAAGNYAAAYRLVGGGWERYFPDRPELSNMNDLGQYDAFLILVTGDVSCEMPVADAPGTQRTLDWGVGWQNDGWTGSDGTSPQDAFACAAGSYAAAYRLVGGGWERYFPDRPDISNMGPLNKYDAFLILVTAPVSCTMAIGP
jgi:hypothetical protein